MLKTHTIHATLQKYQFTRLVFSFFSPIISLDKFGSASGPYSMPGLIEFIMGVNCTWTYVIAPSRVLSELSKGREF